MGSLPAGSSARHAVAIDCSHRTRRICHPDRECVAGARASRARHHSPRRVAVLLRGVAFRNWGSRRTEGSCCNGTETQQRAVVESLDERLFEPLEARGFEVSVYLSTYRCSNGRPWVERDLLPRLAPRLRGLYIGDEANTTQTQTFVRALELAAAEASSREDQSIDAPRDALAFEHIFILRLDMARAGVGSSLLTLARRALDASSATGIQRRVSTQELTRSNLTCLLAQDGPMTHRTNTDQFTRISGRYLCGNQNYGAFPRHRCDASSMAWRCRFLAARRVHPTHRLISTQVGTSPAPSGRDSPCLSGTSGSPRFSRCPALTGRRGPSSTAHRPSGPVWKSNFTPSTRRLLDSTRHTVDFHKGRDAERLEEGLPERTAN